MVFVLLSPAKTLKFDQPVRKLPGTEPHFADRTTTIVKTMKKCSAADLMELMDISAKLGELNAQRFKDFGKQPKLQAILAFQGDTYVGFAAKTLDDATLQYAHNHIGMLSGLYGLLQPLDMMEAYRLEMGTSIAIGKAKNLYDFWGNDITAHINALVKKHKLKAVIGCASNEYLSAVDTDALHVPFINCDFKENKNGKLATVGLFAKRARGSMARYVIEHKITDADALKKFDSGGYKFDKKLSTENNFVFVR